MRFMDYILIFFMCRLVDDLINNRLGMHSEWIVYGLMGEPKVIFWERCQKIHFFRFWVS
jgi:hypothetical protein